VSLLPGPATGGRVSREAAMVDDVIPQVKLVEEAFLAIAAMKSPAELANSLQRGGCTAA